MARDNIHSQGSLEFKVVRVSKDTLTWGSFHTTHIVLLITVDLAPGNVINNKLFYILSRNIDVPNHDFF
jgi:hypothetical protein